MNVLRHRGLGVAILRSGGLAGPAQVYGDHGVSGRKLRHQWQPHVARFRIAVQQDHRVAGACDEVVQPRAVYVCESALNRRGGFTSSRFLSNGHQFIFLPKNNRKYLPAPQRTQHVSLYWFALILPPCVLTPIGGSMPESGYRPWLLLKLWRLASRLLWSYLYEAPRTDFGASASCWREHGPCGHATRRVWRG